jgi:predicted nucleic acid-binding Zn ribbon protein
VSVQFGVWQDWSPTLTVAPCGSVRISTLTVLAGGFGFSADGFIIMIATPAAAANPTTPPAISFHGSGFFVSATRVGGAGATVGLAAGFSGPTAGSGARNDSASTTRVAACHFFSSA